MPADSATRIVMLDEDQVMALVRHGMAKASVENDEAIIILCRQRLRPGSGA